MRKLFLLIVVLFTNIWDAPAPSLLEAEIEEMIQIQLENLREVKKAEQFQMFLDSIAYSESRGNPKVYNKYGYIGKYQFGYAARKSCGYEHIRFSDFVKNPSIWSEDDQEIAMIRLLTKNERHLQEIIDQYEGKVIREVKVTKSGFLAAAHLAGAGGVKKYFKYGYNPADAYGTTLEDYLIEFSGFNF